MQEERQVLNRYCRNCCSSLPDPFYQRFEIGTKLEKKTVKLSKTASVSVPAAPYHSHFTFFYGD